MLFSSSAYSQWEEANIGLRTTQISSFSFLNDKVFASSSDAGMLVSTNQGENWVRINNGITNNIVITTIVKDSIIFAGTYDGVFASSNEGNDWKQMGLRGYKVYAFDIFENNLLAGINNQGLYISKNNGLDWELLGLDSIKISDIVVFDSTIFVSTFGVGIYQSNDGGKTWINNGPPYRLIKALIRSGNNLIAGTQDGAYVSTDKGKTWKLQGIIDNDPINFATYENIVFACSYSCVYISYNNGITWEYVPVNNYGSEFKSIGFNNNRIYLGHNGILVSDDFGMSWRRFLNNLTSLFVSSLVYNNKKIYCIGTIIKYSNYSNNIFYFSKNNGKLWESKIFSYYYYGTQYAFPYCVTAFDDYIFVGTDCDIFFSSDDGNNWNRSFDNSLVFFCISGNKNAIISSYHEYFNNKLHTLIRSLDNGNSWSYANTGLSNRKINSIENNNNIFYVCTDSGLYKSTDLGGNWNIIQLDTIPVCIESISFDKSCIVACKDSIYYYISSDEGLNWQKKKIDTLNVKINSTAIYGNYIFAGTEEQGIFLSSDLGDTWIEINDGLGRRIINDLLIADDYIFIATNNEAIYRAKLSDFGITNVIDNTDTGDKQFIFPNPATDLISIKNVNETEIIEIYDFLGSKILETKNKEKIDISNLATGVYFVKVGIKTFSFVKN